MRVLPTLLAAGAAVLATAALADAQSGGAGPSGTTSTGTGTTGTTTTGTTTTGTGTTSTTTPAGPENPGQKFFLDALIKDTKTVSNIRTALRSGAAIVDPATQYADLTGDGKQDAIVRVHSAGAAGVTAVYVFATDGAPKGALRVLFRTQALYRAVTTEADGNRLQIDEPKYSAGDDVCCASKLTRRRYKFSKKSRTFTRTSMETISVSGDAPRRR
ncbi:hypothetical protein DSM112329_01786 [Paraconexibacter sp. AEG42_29]|uniref:VCBS repeat-containing protein n=1 Tax=Paraconexibacter sp. AEG42_29 TaxID=2997339 RepID=A0AAU7ATF2_9ACTN